VPSARNSLFRLQVHAWKERGREPLSQLLQVLQARQSAERKKRTIQAAEEQEADAARRQASLPQPSHLRRFVSSVSGGGYTSLSIQDLKSEVLPPPPHPSSSLALRNEIVMLRRGY